MDEMLDILNEHYQVIGSKYRSEIHELGLLHASFQCWFNKIIDDVPYILFQKRGSMVNFPNLLDITAAGHLKAGERPMDGIREIEEELGISPQFKELISLGIMEDTLPFKGEKKDRECCNLFSYQYQDSLENLTFSSNEVSAIVCIPFSGFCDIIKNSNNSLKINAIIYDGEKTESIQCQLNKNDFVPHSNEYYQYIMKKLKEVFGV